MRGSIWLGVLFCLGMNVVAAAKVYKWVDAQGNVHFGDRPTADAEAVDIQPASGAGKPAAATAAQRRDKTERLLRAWEEERRLAAEQEAQAVQAKQQRASKCNTARDESSHLAEGWRYYDLDDAGNRRYLNDAELQEQAEFWRRQVEYWCD